jgi:hypothetical protein
MAVFLHMPVTPPDLRDLFRDGFMEEMKNIQRDVRTRSFSVETQQGEV